MAGDKVDHIYSRVLDVSIPASLITSMWCDRDMAGSIDISLAQISCRFSIVDATADEFLFILKSFMHDIYVSKDASKSLYNEMLELKNNYREKEEEQGVLF